MDIAKAPKDLRMVLRASFDASTGVLEIAHRAEPPATFGSALAIGLTSDEARRLAEALLAFAARG